MKGKNFYILLDISYDPPEENEKVIRKAIDKKRLEWSSMRNHPSKKLKAKLYLEMIPEIEKVMLYDKKTRRKQAIEAKVIKCAENKRLYEELDRLIAFLSVKGYIAEEELKALRNKFKKVKELDILNRIQVNIRDKNKGKINKQYLESTTYRKISDNLKIIGEKSLYTFLEVNPTSNIQFLNEASKKMYEQIRRICCKNAVISAKGELQGLCDVVFKNENMKQKYDNSLSKESLMEINKYIDIAGSKRFITREEFGQFIKTIVKFGFKKNEAIDYLLDYCDKNHLAVQVPEKNFQDGINQSGFYENTNNSLEKEKLKADFNMSIKEICDLKIIPKDGHICLSWNAPIKAFRIEVYRKKGCVPLYNGDGDSVINVRLDGVEDFDVENNINYGYLICTVFKDIYGKEIYTNGVTCYGKPIKIPEPIEDLKLIKKNNRLEIKYPSGIKNKVDLIYSKKPFDYNAGQIVLRSNIDKIGRKLSFESNGRCILSIKTIGKFFILPLVSTGNISVVGVQMQGEYIDSVTNLKAYIINNRIHLNWDFPQNIDKVYVGYKKDGDIEGINDSNAIYEEVNLEKYKKQSSYIIKNLSKGMYYIKVFSMIEDKYSKKYSEGSKCKVVCNLQTENKDKKRTLKEKIKDRILKTKDR